LKNFPALLTVDSPSPYIRKCDAADESRHPSNKGQERYDFGDGRPSIFIVYVSPEMIAMDKARHAQTRDAPGNRLEMIEEHRIQRPITE
jgi:hypothetical protein